MNFSQFFFTFTKILFLKNIRKLVQLPEKFLCVIWNLVTKNFEIHNVTFTLKKFQKRKKIEEIHMDSEKFKNLLEIKKRIG